MIKGGLTLIHVMFHKISMAVVGGGVCAGGSISRLDKSWRGPGTALLRVSRPTDYTTHYSLSGK